MEGSDSFVHMARRPSEAFLLTDGEVHGSGVPGGPEVKRVEAVERFCGPSGWAQGLAEASIFVLDFHLSSWCLLSGH